jgi:nitrile hydratase
MGLLKAERVEAAVMKGRSARLDDAVEAKFRVGDRVVVRRLNPTGHTRVPRYVRGCRGVIDRHHGVFIFPDTNAHFQGKKPQHLYSVRFAADEVWGPAASAADRVYVDLWDDYLDPA